MKTPLGNVARGLAISAVSMLALMPMRGDADTVQLGFILDGSGSIGAGNWTTIVNGLSSAVNTLIPVGGTTTYEISVVSFGSNATINIDSFLVDSAAARTALATQIAALPFLNGGSTNYAAAFNAMETALFNGSQAGITANYVNFATDGFNNAVSNATAVAARDSLIAAGVDNLSIEAIGTSLDVGFLTGSICYPQVCDTTLPYNFPSQGFFIQVADANGYAGAISTKIRTVVNPTPEPGTLALLGLGLFGLGLTRRKAA